MAARESEAIILRTYPLGEADRLVSFLSRSWGRLRGVAVGARHSGAPLDVSADRLFRSLDGASGRLAAAARPLFAVRQGIALDSVLSLPFFAGAALRRLPGAERHSGFSGDAQVRETHDGGETGIIAGREDFGRTRGAVERLHAGLD